MNDTEMRLGNFISELFLFLNFISSYSAILAFRLRHVQRLTLRCFIPVVVVVVALSLWTIVPKIFYNVELYFRNIFMQSAIILICYYYKILEHS